MLNEKITAIIFAMAITATIGTSALITGCGNNKKAEEKSKNTISTTAKASTEDIAGIANPWQDCGQDTEMAEKIAGFSIKAPAFSNYTIYAMNGVIEIQIDTEDNGTISFRKAESDNVNVSGIYEELHYVMLDNKDLKTPASIGCDSDGNIKVATWSQGDYSYTMTSDGEIEVEDVVNYINQMYDANA